MKGFRITALLALTLVGVLVAWQVDRFRLEETEELLRKREGEIARQKEAWQQDRFRLTETKEVLRKRDREIAIHKEELRSTAQVTYPYYTVRGPRNFLAPDSD